MASAVCWGYDPLANHLHPPETDIAPGNGWLEDYGPLGKARFQVLC